MPVAYLFVPHFPLAVEARERPELGAVRRVKPIVIGGAPEERKAVVDCSPEAIRDGVHRGMPLREALSRCPEAIFLEARHALYRDVAAVMQAALDRMSPLVEPVRISTAIGVPGAAYRARGAGRTGRANLWSEANRDGAGLAGSAPTEPGRFFIGLTGLAGLHGGSETALVEALAAAIEGAVSLTPRIGVADGKFAAYVAALGARANRPRIVPPGRSIDFLADLAVTYLPISPEMRRRLYLLGIHRMGQLAALPLGAVQAQFGPEGHRAWNLVRGVDDAVVTTPPPTEILAEKMVLPAPVASFEILIAVAKHLLARLLAHPECQYRAARRVEFRAALTNGQVWERALTFREPRNDFTTILTALRGKIDNTAGPEGAPALVEEVELRFSDWCALASTPQQLFPSQRARQQLRIDEAIRQLTTRYGRTPIARIVEVEPWSRIPERRYALIDYEA